MVLIAYRRGRLLLFAAASLAGGAFLLRLWLHPEVAARAHSLFLRSLAGPVGHWLVLPAIMLGCALGAWRFALTARHAAALVQDADGLTINTLGGPRTVPWRELERIEQLRVAARGLHDLLIFRVAGRDIPLGLGATDLAPEEIAPLVASIMRSRDAALAVRSTPRPMPITSSARFGRRAA